MTVMTEKGPISKYQNLSNFPDPVLHLRKKNRDLEAHGYATLNKTVELYSELYEEVHLLNRATIRLDYYR